MSVIPAFPLAWPAGWFRTEDWNRTRAQFRKASRKKWDGSWENGRSLTINEAVERVREQLTKMGIDADDLVISTNLLLRLDGFPRSSQAEPKDPGVAVYWTDHVMPGAPPRCMAIDRYDRIADNLAAVAATLDAMRAIERHGGAEILNRAFSGFVLLAGPMDLRQWWEVLGLSADANAGNIVQAYRRLRSVHHPDKGGDPTEFQAVQIAYDQAVAEGKA